MQNRNWLTSETRQRRLFGVLRQSSRRRAQRRFATVFCVVTLLALVTLLSGCHSLPSKPCETLPLPTPPALSEPAPSVSYSEQWRLLVEQSRKNLTDTPQTQK